MRLIKVFSLVAFATAISAGLIGVSSASALVSTELCKVHPASTLVCPTGEAVEEDMQELKPNTLWVFLTDPVNVLCLSALKKATASALGNPQFLHTMELTIGGCGTAAGHNNCTVTAEQLPELTLLKIGLDEGILTALNGSLRIQCANLGLNCLYDLAGLELTMGNQLTHSGGEFETPIQELGGKFFCPDEASLDYLLVTEKPHYILG